MPIRLTSVHEFLQLVNLCVGAAQTIDTLNIHPVSLDRFTAFGYNLGDLYGVSFHLVYQAYAKGGRSTLEAIFRRG